VRDLVFILVLLAELLLVFVLSVYITYACYGGAGHVPAYVGCRGKHLSGATALVLAVRLAVKREERVVRNDVQKVVDKGFRKPPVWREDNNAYINAPTVF
jgi:hypothetical protein